MVNKKQIFYQNATRHRSMIMKKQNILYKICLLSGIILINVGCDQTTKKIAHQHLASGNQVEYFQGIFTFVYAENTGAFLGLGSHLGAGIKQLFLVIVPAVLLAFLMVTTFFSRRISTAQAIAISFVIGGGVSNIFDRIFYGKVIDFMHFSMGYFQTGIFNMADLSIMTGLLLTVIFQVFSEKSNQNAFKL